MSLPISSDYEVISNAEVSSVISKYTPDMLDTSLETILKRKGTAIVPLANLINSYEMDFRMDSERYPDISSDIGERRTELYGYIVEKICTAHALKPIFPSNIEVFTWASIIYDFLISNFKNHVINFFSRYLQTEAANICQMYDLPDDGNDAINRYARERYGANGTDIAIIHTHLTNILDLMGGFDISLENIIDLCYGPSPEAVLLKSSLIDDGDFFKYVYMPAVSGENRPLMCTSIRLKLLPISVNKINSCIQEGE